MRTVTTGIVVAMMLMLVCAATAPSAAQDEQPRISVDFQNEPLGQVLQMLKRGWGLEYTVGQDVDTELPITAHLRDMALGEALKTILEPNGLMPVDQNGRYVIKVRPTPTARDTEAVPVTPTAGAGARPAPTRPS